MPAGAATECVSHLGPVAVQDIPGKGRGVVVTRDVEVGELLFADKALSICGKAALLQQTVERLKHCSKAEYDAFCLLSDGTAVPEVPEPADGSSSSAEPFVAHGYAP